MTTVGVVCPKCGGFTTEEMTHPQNLPAFICRNCNVIVEPTSMGSSYTYDSRVHNSVTELPPSAVPAKEQLSKKKHDAETEPDWSRKCEICGESPIEPEIR